LWHGPFEESIMNEHLPAKLLGLVLLLTVTAPAFGRAPQDAPRLPRPQGSVVVVADVESLYRAVAGLKSNTTILLQRGNYRLSRPVYLKASSQLKDVAIRGATGDFQDVVLVGAGMGNRKVGVGILAEMVDGLLIADMTIGWVGFHPIALSPNEVRNVHVYHCRLVDAGEQFVKVNFTNPATAIHNGVVEYCLIEYTNFGPAGGYTNGVDVLGGYNWVIRHNLFRNIRSEQSGRMAGPSVLAWKGAANTRCEQNTFVNCDRSIVFGLERSEGVPDHRGGIIANNFIVVNKDQTPRADAGIDVWDSPGTRILHNTVLLQGAYPNAIEVRWESSKNVVVQNNLTDAGITGRDGAQFLGIGNQRGATPEMFKKAATGDLHLVAGVRTATVPRVPDCTTDWDGADRGATTAAGAVDPASTPRK
jgi:hypothetical protein